MNNFDYVWINSREYGLMDQKHYLTENQSRTKKTLYIFKGVALNWREAGNCVWGAAIAKLSITWDTAVLGAHIYKLYREGQLDEFWELKAAKLGYYGHKTFSLPITGF